MKSEECACHLSRLTALLCEQAEKPLQYIQVFDLNSQLQLGQYADKLRVDAVHFWNGIKTTSSCKIRLPLLTDELIVLFLGE